VKAVAVDSSEYTKLNSKHIPADERFLYTFMKMRQEQGESAQEKKKQKTVDDFEGDIDDNESIESVSDDEFDKYL
ncbi:unnamed protein product, partial [Adineta steineri]